MGDSEPEDNDDEVEVVLKPRKGRPWHAPAVSGLMTMAAATKRAPSKAKPKKAPAKGRKK